MLHRRFIISSLKPLHHRSCFCHLTTTSQILSSTSFFHHSSHTNSNHHKRRTSDHHQHQHHSNNNNRNQQSSSSSASASSFHQTSAPFFSNRMSTPFVVKDREPFPGTELRDGKLKLAVLIDGEKVNPENYQKFAEKEISQSGTICLRRYFRYEKLPEWSSLFHRGASSTMATSEEEVTGEQTGMNKNNNTSISGKSNTHPTSTLPRKTPNTASIDTLLGPPQFFRVDSFIPINMQLSADAAHIVEFKNENLVTGVVFVVAKDEVPAYETLIENNFLGQQVKMFVVDGDAEGKVRVKK